MSETASALIADIREAFTGRANRDIAMQQQAYMKSDMPYFGLKAPAVRDALKPLLKLHTLRSRQEWEGAIRSLWDTATHREEWYAAISVARYGRYRELRASLESLPLYEHMIRTGAWWDVCDEIAHHLVGPVLLARKDAASEVMRTWSTDDHLWIRRCSILSQGTHKHATDSALLRDCILPSIDDTDVFSRKAIGWALRDYSKVDHAWVRAFVAEFDARLSSLSKREALRLSPQES